MIEHSVHVALLNETDTFSLDAANNEADGAGKPRPGWYSEAGTIARDSWIKNGVLTPMDRIGWSAAIVSPLGPVPLRDDDVRAFAPSRRDPVVHIPFANSRPGTWVAATVGQRKERATCVSLYGLIEELTDASMHRSLSDISPVFSDPEHSQLVFLGGDFNVSTALADPDERKRSRIVLNRIEAYGMFDCLAEWRRMKGLAPLDGCACEDDPCLHTLTRLFPNSREHPLPWRERVAPQVDYLFVSERLRSRLENVIEMPPEEWERFSDHRPMIVTFADKPIE